MLGRQSERSYNCPQSKIGAEEMVQHEDLNSIPGSLLEKKKKPVMEACACHPSAGKAEIGGSHHLPARLPTLFDKLQAPEKFCLKASRQASKQTKHSKTNKVGPTRCSVGKGACYHA